MKDCPEAKKELFRLTNGKIEEATEEMLNEKQWFSIDQIAQSERFPFTPGQLRHFLMYRHKNGLEKACSKIGKRIYVRIDLFEEWIDSYRKKMS